MATAYIRLLANIAGTWGGGFKNDVLPSPDYLPSDVANAMIAAGKAIDVTASVNASPPTVKDTSYFEDNAT